jgi:hypothetical protein
MSGHKQARAQASRGTSKPGHKQVLIVKPGTATSEPFCAGMRNQRFYLIMKLNIKILIPIFLKEIHKC